MHIRIRAKKYFLGMKTRVIGQWILISTLVFHMPDCTIDDAQKAQFQAKHGDEMYYEPFTPKPPRGSVEDIQHRLRISGLRLRRELNHSLLTDPDQWTALRRPASLHTAQRTLAEMLMSIPSADQEHFHDGYPCRHCSVLPVPEQYRQFLFWFLRGKEISVERCEGMSM